MNLKHISIFNLIEIFRGKRSKLNYSINPEKHCEHKQLHDFYCDSDEVHNESKVAV
ncbi:hypothetical protein [Seonamhaeicola maritimus]|uniref:hypothetical protein n=1 Tax=Seonamhaeicola maritimus TaxID=2591822 RepID=UPI0024944A55|nr:hypothetical protein [Seonamhaeicola maritimus]